MVKRKDISNKTLAIILVIAIIVSLLGNLFIYNKLSETSQPTGQGSVEAGEGASEGTSGGTQGSGGSSTGTISVIVVDR